MFVDQKNSRIWPNAIIGGYIVFVAFALGFVFIAYTERVDLVSVDYYAEEIAYQEHLERVHRTNVNKLGKFWDIRKEESKYLICYGPFRKSMPVMGRIHLYRPSDSNLDRLVPIGLLGNGCQTLPHIDQNEGMWRIKIMWEAGGESYYSERKIQSVMTR